MSSSILQVVSLCLSEYYRLCLYVFQHITGCIRMCPHMTRCIRISVRILQVVSLCVRIIQVVSVLLSEYYRLHPYVSAYDTLYPYFCPHITGCVIICPNNTGRVRIAVRILQVASVCVRIWHVVSVFLSAYYRLYPYVCMLLVVFFLHAQNCFHLYACPQITGTALCIVQAPIMSLRTLQVLSHVSAYFRLRRLVKALIASVIVTSVTHKGRQLVPVLHSTMCHFVYQFLKLPVDKCSSNEHCALQERLNKQINESPY